MPGNGKNGSEREERRQRARELSLAQVYHDEEWMPEFEAFLAAQHRREVSLVRAAQSLFKGRAL